LLFFCFPFPFHICKDDGPWPRLLEIREEGGDNPPKEAGPEYKKKKEIFFNNLSCIT